MAHIEPKEAPLVSFGPSGLKGEYRVEIVGTPKKHRKRSVFGMTKVLLNV